MNRVSRSLVVTAALPLASCMATFDHYVPDANQHPLERQAQAGPAVVLATTFDRVDPSMGTHSDTPPLPPEWITRIFLESGGFSAVRAPSDTADSHAAVLIRTERGRIDGGILWLLSAFLIPSVQDRTVLVRVSLENGAVPERQAVREFKFRVWYELLILPFYFTNGPARSEHRFIEQMLRDCIAEVLRPGRV